MSEFFPAWVARTVELNKVGQFLNFHFACSHDVVPIKHFQLAWPDPPLNVIGAAIRDRSVQDVSVASVMTTKVIVTVRLILTKLD